MPSFEVILNAPGTSSRNFMWYILLIFFRFGWATLVPNTAYFEMETDSGYSIFKGSCSYSGSIELSAFLITYSGGERLIFCTAWKGKDEYATNLLYWEYILYEWSERISLECVYMRWIKVLTSFIRLFESILKYTTYGSFNLYSFMHFITEIEKKEEKNDWDYCILLPFYSFFHCMNMLCIAIFKMTLTIGNYKSSFDCGNFFFFWEAFTL